jgi:hypothetical protein
MKKFVVFWDCYGLESCVDITESIERGNNFEKESIFERIKNPGVEPRNEWAHKVSQMVHVMQLRAGANPQRNYELYMLNATHDMTAEDITEWFKDSPQEAANRVREIGYKLMSNRATDIDRRVIV